MRRPTSIRSLNKRVLAEDDVWTVAALQLASRGEALAHPNPMVGAIVEKGGRTLGEGFHTYDGKKHAEIIALEKAGNAARGATLYVNLEPCCHTGRTGPCTEAIIAAGIKRVVAAMKDSNPLVSGRGFARLRRAGVEVVVGIRENEARRLNEAYGRWIRTGQPFVTLKTALTLDGKVAASRGSAASITSPESREQVQRLRHASDALLTGIGTVLADDPRLTDRTGKPRRRPLLRVVADTKLRTPLRSTLVRSANKDVLVFTAQPLDSPKAHALRKAGVELCRVPAREGHVDLRQIIRELGRRQILGVLLEAGAELNGAALESGIVDKMILFFAPKMFGTKGVPVAQFHSGAKWLPGKLKITSVGYSGPDLRVEGYFHDVYRDR